jgi:DNA-binding beta-propeller fold protein YncE
MKVPSSLFVLFGCLAACGAQRTPPVSAPAAAGKSDETHVTKLGMEAIALPGAAPPVSLDFLFYESQGSRVWVPAGGTGSVDVFDIAKRDFVRVEGFGTAEREAHGKKRVLGPSAGAIGDGFAYIGNRATQEICAVDLKTLKKGACLELPAPPDCVEYVSSTSEVWVTTPKTQSLVVLAATPQGGLSSKSIIKIDGAPEGYALDESRGLFLTNLEDKGTTLTIDLKTHAVRDTWNAGCSAAGPRGIAVDSARALVLVACTDHVQALDMAHDGALLGKLDTGAGLDNIDYASGTGLLYAAAGKAARLTVAHVGDHGELTPTATAETAPGARNAVVDAKGNVYVADPQGAHLLLLSPKKP